MYLQHFHNLEMQSACTQNRTLHLVLENIQPISICQTKQKQMTARGTFLLYAWGTPVDVVGLDCNEEI